MDAKTIKDLLQKHNAKPSKGLGQNFLVNEGILEKIIQAANLSNEDVVVEIGPGLGVLTQALAKKVRRVIAVEKDRTMVAILQETLKGFNNVEIIQADALEFELPNSSYKVIANIPYYITSPLIRKLLEATTPPTNILLMVQKEVAQRICAKPPKMSLLAVAVQCYADPKTLFPVSKGSFWPAPTIDSAVIQITPRKEKLPVTMDDFFKVVKAGFLHPRKQLINNLTEGLTIEKEGAYAWLVENNIDPSCRAETLTIEDWVGLTRALARVYN